MIKPRRWQLAATAAILTAGAGLAAALTTTAAQAQSASGQQSGASGCITIKLVEPLGPFYSSVPVTAGAQYTVGFKGAAFDTLYDTAGNTVGSSVLSTDNVYANPPSTNHVFEYVAETLNLGDGTLLATGAYDRVSVAAHDWQHAKIIGLSGRYAGMSGTWTWQLSSLTPPYPTQEAAVLCPSQQ